MSNDLTIRDVARMAGVSTTAVSFVINGKVGVSDSTRERVLEIIKKTGFTTNVHARRLNTGKSMTLHVILWQYQEGIFDQFAFETLNGMFSESRKRGYSIVLTFADRTSDTESLKNAVRSKDCDGVILYQVDNASFIAFLQDENIPFVCVDAHLPKNGTFPVVEVDYYDAAKRAVTYLSECGHKKIGFVGASTPMDFYINTFSAFGAVVSENGLVCKPHWIIPVPYDEKEIESAIKKLVNSGDCPTAFFCTGDAFAVNVARSLKKAGLRIPKDVSVIGTDDIVVSKYTDPPLTTMTFDKELMGKAAVEVLCSQMLGTSSEKVRLLKTEIITRRSVRII